MCHCGSTPETHHTKKTTTNIANMIDLDIKPLIATIDQLLIDRVIRIG
jgi:hypothetical protein